MPKPKKRTKKAKRTGHKGKPEKQKQLTPGQWFEKLVAVQAKLRAPNGCPWDREQTHQSLRTYLIEEAYEVLEALESGDDGKFAEEMGDLLLQIVFHSQIGARRRALHCLRGDPRNPRQDDSAASTCFWDDACEGFR